MKFKVPITIAILGAFLFVGSFGVIAMTGMDGHHHELGCPFMPGEQTICDMSPLDHIGAWQSTFTITLPPLFVYLILVVAALFIWKYYSPPDLFVRRILPSRIRDLVPVPLYQELFSSGILNPRAP